MRTCGEAIVGQWDVQVASPEEVNRGREVLNESSKLEVHFRLCSWKNDGNIEYTFTVSTVD